MNGSNNKAVYIIIAIAAVICIFFLLTSMTIRPNQMAPNAPAAKEEDTEVPESAPDAAAEQPDADSDTAVALPDAPEDANEDIPATPPEGMAGALAIRGTAQEITAENQILVKSDAEGSAYPEVMLQLTDETLILDVTDFSEKAKDDIQTGDFLCAWFSPVMTRSLPPISNAAVILTGVTEDAAAPNYAVVTEVNETEEGTTELVTDMELNLYVSGDTPVLALDGSSLTIADLKPGTRVLAWYDMMTMSIPAMAHPEEIRVLP